MSRIGKYEIQGEIGRGGFGLVYRGFDPAVGRPVAIKVLTSEGDESLSSRFRNEAAAAGKLRHKNIVTVYEFGEHKGRPFLVMEYLEGEDLAHIIASRKPLTLLEKVGIMSQVAEGLHCAHQNGVIHRDVKPANIMVLPDGAVKIMDFGIARVLREDATRLTRKGDMIGTMLYMSPEQFTSAEVDALCDIFAYGAIYYELLAGKHPFRAADAAAMMYKITVEDPEPVRRLAAACPQELEDLVTRALQKDRDLRYQSMRELQVDAEPILMALRQERALELATQAQSLLDSGDLEASRKLVLEALNFNPANRSARQIREVLQNARQRAAIQPRLEAFLKTAADDMAARRFPEAIQGLEAALRLDRDNTGVIARLEDARQFLERTRRAARLIGEARRAYQQQALDLAKEKLDEALREDPGNPEAPLILKRLEDEIRAREEARKLKEGLERATQLLNEQSFDEAVGLLARLASEHPQSGEAAASLARARSEKTAYERRQRFHAELAAAADAMHEGRLAEATEALEAIAVEFPGEREAADLLAYARRKLQAQRKAEAVQKIAADASACAEEHKFADALRAIEQGLQAYPGESALVRLLESTRAARADWEREQAIRAVCQEADEAMGRGELSPAIALLRRAISEYPREPRLAELLARAEQALEARRKEIAAVCKEARALADSASFDAALQTAAKALEKYPDEEPLHALRGEIATAKQAWEREQAILAVCETGRERIDGREFESAIDLLQNSSRRYAGEKRIAALLERAEQGKAARERAAAIASLTEEAGALYAAGDLSAAEKLAREGLSRWPDEQPLRELLAAIEAQQKHRLAVAALCSEASRLCAAEDYAGALALAQRGLESYPGERALLDLVQTVTRSREEWRRKRTGDTFIAAGKLLRAGRYDEALALLRGRISECGDPSELATLLEQAEKRRAASIAARELEERARALAGEADFDGALRLLDEGAELYPGEEALSRTRDRIAGQRAEWNRKREVSASAASIEALRSEGKVEEALAAVREAIRSMGRVPPLVELEARLSDDWERRQRRDRDLQSLRDLDAALRRDAQAQSFDRAAAAHLRASSEWPGDGEIQKASAALREQVSAIGAAREAFGREDYERAAEACATGLRRYPEHAFFARMLAELETLRRQRLSAFRAHIDARLAGEPDLDRRYEILHEALGVYPGDPHLQAELRFNESRRRLVNSIIAKAREHEQAGEYEESLEQWNALASAYREYPELERHVRRLTALRDGRRAAPKSEPPAPIVETVNTPGPIEPQEVTRIQPFPTAGAIDFPGFQEASTVLMRGPGATPPARKRRTTRWVVGAGVAAAGIAAALFGLGVFQPHAARQPTVQVGAKPEASPPEALPSPAPAAEIAPKQTDAAEPSAAKEADRVEEKRTVAPPAPAPAYLEIAGAEPGAEVNLDGQRIGEIAPDGSFGKPVAPGHRTVELTKDGYTPSRFIANFTAGAHTWPSREQVALAKIIQPPPPPDPRQIEADDWQRVAGSANPDDFTRFLSKHPDGAHASEARNRATQLRQQIQANAVKKAEQDAWTSLDKNNMLALQDFLAHYGAGAHAQDARDKIAAIDLAEKQAAAAKLARQEKEQEEQRAQRLAADRQSIDSTLKALETAYAQKDSAAVQKLWIEMPKNLGEEFKRLKTMEYRIRQTTPPEISGDTAKVRCVRTSQVTTTDGSRPPRVEVPVLVTLERRANGWIIRSIATN